MQNQKSLTEIPSISSEAGGTAVLECDGVVECFIFSDSSSLSDNL